MSRFSWGGGNLLSLRANSSKFHFGVGCFTQPFFFTKSTFSCQAGWLDKQRETPSLTHSQSVASLSLLPASTMMRAHPLSFPRIATGSYVVRLHHVASRRLLLYILLQLTLSPTHNFARSTSWPRAFIASYTPSSHLFLGLPLGLTPGMLDS